MRRRRLLTLMTRGAGWSGSFTNGSVNNNVSANYSYDKADNRNSVNVVSPNSPP